MLASDLHCHYTRIVNAVTPHVRIDCKRSRNIDFHFRGAAPKMATSHMPGKEAPTSIFRRPFRPTSPMNPRHRAGSLDAFELLDILSTHRALGRIPNECAFLQIFVAACTQNVAAPCNMNRVSRGKVQTNGTSIFFIHNSISLPFQRTLL